MAALTEQTPPTPGNRFAALVRQQKILPVASFVLESGITLFDVPVAYKTWGHLNSARDNALVVCHPLPESADVEEWWGPLLGPGKAFDTTKFFVICCNSLGSPYGTASPVTIDPTTGKRYGPTFPITTVRDDVKLHRNVLEVLGVHKVACVVGGSMGGMHALEWALICKDYVRTIVPIATCAKYSEWSMIWTELQRQCILLDLKYENGYYSLDEPPLAGLEIAQKWAFLTNRGPDAFNKRYRREIPANHLVLQQSSYESKFSENKKVTVNNKETSSSHRQLAQRNSAQKVEESSLQHYSTDFAKRFDANCFIKLTHKVDTYDIARDRTESIEKTLKLITQPTLVLGSRSDGMVSYQEQRQLTDNIPDSRLAIIDGLDGHNAFLLQCEGIGRHIKEFFKSELPDIM